jgi:hypothetical protein
MSSGQRHGHVDEGMAPKEEERWRKRRKEKDKEKKREIDIQTSLDMGGWWRVEWRDGWPRAEERG